ncbi:hypothetical protein [Carnobacterium divergens]|uniref:hypothetical protein n=1 Tax=Carnobacterium divergens TaxID=2748 RepID=UPI00288E420B|nr:hypothetical protein [Carnobacterium divergens]MDT2011134.1 hypothetical protein [Carnobacterium divergens]
MEHCKGEKKKELRLVFEAENKEEVKELLKDIEALEVRYEVVATIDLVPRTKLR